MNSRAVPPSFTSTRRRPAWIVYIERLEEFVSALLIATILAVVFGQVVARYVLSQPIFWADELARYSYVWLAFVAGVHVTARRTHVKITVIDRILTPFGLKVVECFATLVVAGTCLALVIGSFDWLQTTARPKSSSLRMPMIWLYGVVWFSFALMMLHSLANLYLVATGRRSVEDDPLEAALE